MIIKLLAFLVGSRAIEWHLKQLNRRGPSRPPVDYDLAGSIFSATSFVADHEYNILSLEEHREPLDAENSFEPDAECGPCKFFIRLRNGAMIEWEVAEYVTSLQVLLDKHAAAVSSPVNANSFTFAPKQPQIECTIDTGMELRVLNLEALILMKLSHIWWPIHWKKTAEDLAEYRTLFPSYFASARSPMSAESVLESIKDESLRQIMKEFYETHTAEIASRWLRNHPNENRLELTVLTDELESKFSSCGQKRDEQLKFVTDWLENTALETFLAQIIASNDSPSSPAGSWLHDPSVTRQSLAKECWLWAIQSLVTDRMAEIEASPALSGELYHMSPFERIQELAYQGANRAAFQQLYVPRVLPQKAPEVEKVETYNYAIGFLDDISYNMALDTFPHLSKSLSSFCTANLTSLIQPTESLLKRFDERLGTLLSPAPTLPDDIWRTICSLSNHMAVCRVTQTCRKMNQILAGTSSVWEQLCKRCWNGGPTAKGNFKSWFIHAHASRWTELKHPVFDCDHCKRPHERITTDEWEEYLNDPRKDGEFCQFAEHWCICPKCTARSWSSCFQYNKQFL